MIVGTLRRWYQLNTASSTCVGENIVTEIENNGITEMKGFLGGLPKATYVSNYHRRHNRKTVDNYDIRHGCKIVNSYDVGCTYKTIKNYDVRCTFKTVKN